MTGEEMERAIAFILEQQARLDTTVGRLSEKVDRNAETATALLAIAQIQATEIRDLTASTRDLTASTRDLTASVQVLADRQREAEARGRRTDERLDALITIVERHISEGRNGKA